MPIRWFPDETGKSGYFIVERPQYTPEQVEALNELSQMMSFSSGDRGPIPEPSYMPDFEPWAGLQKDAPDEA